MKKILEIIISLPKTILFNFKYLKIKNAIKLPFFVSYNVKLSSLKGNIYITAPIKTAMIRIGFGYVGIYDKARSRTIWEVSGNVTFKGKASIGHGSKICVAGDLELGDNFVITAESKIVAYKKIKFGYNCLVAFENLIIDTDFHKITDENKNILNEDKEIIIGNDVWIGTRCTILKGTIINDCSVIAANSCLYKKFTESNVAIGGNPAKIIKRNIKWKV